MNSHCGRGNSDSASDPFDTTMSFAPIPNEEALHGREQELRRFEQSLRALESSVHAKLSILQSSDVHNLPKQDIEQLLQTTQLHNTALEQKHRPGEPRDEDHSIKLHYPGTALSGLHASTQESLATKYHKVVRQLQEKDVSSRGFISTLSHSLLVMLILNVLMCVR